MLGVVKIGSALFANPEKEYIESLRKFIKEFKGELAFVSGAGPGAKRILKTYRKFKFPEGFLDRLGIELTHINAKVLARLINGTYCKDFAEVEKSSTGLPVTGGQAAGQSTDAVAAGLADYLEADVLILVKDVGGIYSGDPKKNPGARLIHKITLEEMENLLEKNPRAGHYGVLDRRAFEIIKRSKMKTYVIGPDFNFNQGTEVKH